MLPPDDEHFRQHFDFGEESWEDDEHTVSDSDTEVPAQGMEQGPRADARPHANAYLEGSFGRLNVEDQRLAMDERRGFH